MSNNQYSPLGIWHDYDFQVNKHFWSKKGYEASIAIRKDNLKTLTNILTEVGISYWLQGQTLKGVYSENALPDDHDDDIGIWHEDSYKLINTAKPLLEEKGFKLIRDTSQIVSFEKDYRYIDICIFHYVGTNTVKYAQKSFPATYYKSFGTVRYDNHEFSIPVKTAEILKHLYGKKFPKLRSLLKRAQSLLTTISKTDSRSRLYKKIQIILLNKIAEGSILSNILLRIAPLFDIKRVKLSQADFESLRIEPSNSYNWSWRKRHLDIVTDGGKCQTISDIVTYLSHETTQKNIQSLIIESDMLLAFQTPLNLDMNFWWSGNNYFWYCIKYGFRRNVVSYSNSLEYIRLSNNPLLYSAQYYEQLPEMTEAEIETFLLRHPIEVVNGSIVGGKHRAFAMIGRLIASKSYRSISALVAC